MAGLEIISHSIIFTNIIKAAQPNASFLGEFETRQSLMAKRI